MPTHEQVEDELDLRRGLLDLLDLAEDASDERVLAGGTGGGEHQQVAANLFADGLGGERGTSTSSLMTELMNS